MHNIKGRRNKENHRVHKEKSIVVIVSCLVWLFIVITSMFYYYEIRHISYEFYMEPYHVQRAAWMLQAEIQDLKKVTNQMRVYKENTITEEDIDVFITQAEKSLPKMEDSVEILEDIRSNSNVRKSVHEFKTYFAQLEQEVKELVELLEKKEFSQYLDKLNQTTNVIYNEGIDIVDQLILSNGREIENSIKRMDTTSQITAILLALFIVTVVGTIVSFQRKLYKKSIELEEALEAANQAVQVKEDFLSHMSHEIRNPIYAINGLCGLLEGELNESERAIDYVKSISLSSNYLLALVNNVLDEAKLEHNKMILANEIFSMTNFMNDFIQTIQLQMLTKGIQFKTEIGGLTEYVYGDSLRLHQVLTNICSNAIKFTEKNGEIQIKVHIVDQDDERVKVEFEISDNGIGMSEEFKQKLFQPFEQDKVKKVQQGTGLGMTITYQLVQLMQGEIFVDSMLGIGTSVHVVVPFLKIKNEKSACQEEQMYQTYMESERLKGKNILVVEDNAINVDIVRSLLENVGMNVDVAKNGMEAVQKFVSSSNEYYQVILMDIELPDMNGYMVSEAIRSSNRKDAEDVAILALTADMDRNGIEKLQRKRLNGYILKPIDVEMLYHTLNDFMQIKLDSRGDILDENK